MGKHTSRRGADRDRAAETLSAGDLLPFEMDLAARVIYFPVRHHSPACAWHVERVIREVRPEAVLIEGPRDATPLIPLLTHEQTQTPVAIYATFVRRSKEKGAPPERYSAYYPLCDYSPELAAIRAAKETGADCRFIDLTFPEMVLAEREPQPGQAQSLHEERLLTHSRLLEAACRRSGARDADDLWDHLFEVDFRETNTERFLRNVLAYCALARRDYSEERLEAEGCLARERAMAAAVTEAPGRAVVVTGGFHTVALPATAGRLPKPVKIAAEDALVVLMRYGFEQLDRLNGYASGMPSPEFYQRVWEGREAATLLVEIARQCREHNLNVSTAEAVAALEHARRLAELRGHGRPSREDVLDAVRSVYVKGAADTEGAPVLALARKLFAGERVGSVPDEAGLPPIVAEFRRSAAELKIDLDRVDAKAVALDLYRRRDHRRVSRLFHRLRFLAVPFAEWLGGPNFVTGESLERIREEWRYRWTPDVESSLVRLALYGSTVEEAASAMLLERFHEAEQQGQGRRADLAAQLVLEACRMGIFRHTQDLLARTAKLVNEDRAFDSLVRAMEQILVLRVSREPLEAHHLTGLDEIAAAAYNRACFVLPELAATPPEAEQTMLNAVNALYLAAGALGDTPERRELRWEQLRRLLAEPSGNPAMRGGAVGLLFGDGQLDERTLVRELEGHLHSTRGEGEDGPNFLRGLLRTARSVLWQSPGCIASLHAVFQKWDEDRFIKLLPLLRLALSDLTPRECDQVAREVAAHAGVAKLTVPALRDLSPADLTHAATVERMLRETLRQDGLDAWTEDAP